MISVLFAIHLVAALVWVGGMFFAHMVLRPASQFLAPNDLIALWTRVLGRFTLWVWATVVLLPVSGYGLAFELYGGLADSGLHVRAMHLIGWLMIGLFVYMYFVPLKRMLRMARESLTPEAAMYMGQIRRIVVVNLVLGIALAVIAAGGRYW